jgi:hypothetical protein
MWKVYLHFILFIFFLSPIGTSAGTLENADFKNYKVQITFDDGQVTHETLYEQCTNNQNRTVSVIMDVHWN